MKIMLNKIQKIKIYWNIKNDDEVFSPFKNKDLAYVAINKEINLIRMLYNKVVYEFNNRYNYIIKINEEKDDELKYKLKRKYIGI